MGTWGWGMALALALISSQAQAVGFSSGDSFTSNLVQGEAFVQCQDSRSGGVKNARFMCREMVLDPVEFDFFEGPGGVQADTVLLTATWESGQVQKKSSRYDSRKGRSENRVNLWVRTLLQKPLLDYGVNKISYELKRGPQSVTTGEFSVTVRRGQTYNCAPKQYFSPNVNDCENQFSICSRYISEARECQ